MPTKETSQITTRQQQKDAGEALIGAIMLIACGGSRKEINTLATWLSPKHFWLETHQRIYTAMLSCTSSPHQINVARELFRQGKFQALDASYMSHCMAVCPCPLDYLDYAHAVKEYSDQQNGKLVVVKGGVEL